MRLLVDTDIFCKLGLAGLLNEALATLGVSAEECGRLPALPRMLQRGGLVKLYGPERCASLLPAAEAMPVAPEPAVESTEPFLNVPAIDPGEAQLFALVAQFGLVLLSGDKRALKAVAKVPGVVSALDGKIVTFEAVLIALCGRLGADSVRRAVQLALANDQTVKICFSAGNPDPLGALSSYLAALERDVAPLVLGKPAMDAA